MFRVAINYVLLILLIAFNVCSCKQTWQSQVIEKSRESLVIQNLTTEEQFVLPENVLKWKSISCSNISFSIGLRNSSFVVLRSNLKDNKIAVIKTDIFELDHNPKDVTLFKYREKETFLVLFIIAKSNNELDWYRLSENHLEKIYSKNVDGKIYHLNQFEIYDQGKNYFLSLISQKSDQIFWDLYKFKFNENKMQLWLQQSTTLQYEVQSTAFANHHNDYFFAIPQKSFVTIFKYESNQFNHFQNITSYSVANVISFDILSKSFLAIDGLNAGIYQFRRNGLTKESIFGSNLEGISYFLSVPVQTYRDECFLMVQRTLDHSTHRNLVIEIMTYNGINFEQHEDTPCLYFGENFGKLGCLTENNLKNGIIGSSYISVDDKLAILVPGKNEMFLVNFDIISQSNPIEDEMNLLEEHQTKLQSIISSIHKTMEEIKNHKSLALHDSDLENKSTAFHTDSPKITLVGQSTPLNLEDLKIKINELGSKINSIKDKVKKVRDAETTTNFRQITIDGPIEVFGTANIEKTQSNIIKDRIATDILQDIATKSNTRKISGHKTFTDATIPNLNFHNVNGISADDLLFKDGKPIIIDGDLTMAKNIDVKSVRVTSGMINDIDFMNEIVSPHQIFNDSLKFDEIIVEEEFTVTKMNKMDMSSNGGFQIAKNVEKDTLFVPQNLTVKKINGIDFDEFLHQLCLINTKCFIPSLTIEGDIEINSSEQPFASKLNDLEFPDEYVFLNEKPHLNISGQKQFDGILKARQIRSRGLIDGINTRDVITLSTPQIIPEITFNNLEVREQLNVSDKIVGKFAEKFLPNPTLLERDQIKSNANFKNIQVEGSVIIHNDFNKTNFKALLEDVVYKDELSTNINSLKVFPGGFSVKNDLTVESEAINATPLKSLVSKELDQILNLDHLNGNVHFEKLYLPNGLFNGINVTKLDQETVKTFGDQFISSTLIFDQPIEVENLEINKLNELSSDDYLFTKDDLILDNVRFNHSVNVERLTVEGNFSGPINGLDLEDFLNNMLSYTRDEEIPDKFVIDDIHSSHFTVENINNIKAEELFSNDDATPDVIDEIIRGNIRIENMQVRDLQINELNGNSMQHLHQRSRLLTDKFMKNPRFQNNVTFKSIKLNQLSGFDFNDFMGNLVFKNESNVKIENVKQFLHPVLVDKLIETKAINNVPVEFIFSKVGNQKFSGPLIVEGNVTVESLLELDEINELPINYIYDNFDITNGTVTIQGEVMFNRVSHILQLVLNGYANGVNVKEFLDNVLYINGNAEIDGNIIFEDSVTIEENAIISNKLNNLNLGEILPNIVLSTKDATIKGLVRFTNPVFVTDSIVVDQELNAGQLFGINTTTWLTDAIFVNKGLLKGQYKFKDVEVNDILNTDFINSVNMKSIIPLKSNQNLSSLTFGEVHCVNDVDVNELVNGLDLLKEIKNTVMNHFNQKISDVIIQNNILVRESLQTSHLNGKDVDKIVTTNTDQELSADYKFVNKVILDEDLTINKSLNSIDLKHWSKDSVKIIHPENQTILTTWNVRGNVTFAEDVNGNVLIDDLHLPKVLEEVEKRRSVKYSYEKGLIEDYNNICRDVNHFYNVAKNQIYKFQYFKEIQRLNFKNQVDKTFYFNFSAKMDYLLIREHDSCTSHLLKFNQTQFIETAILHIGFASQIVKVRDGDFNYLVTTSESSKCNISGTNVWKFDSDRLEIIQKIDDQLLLQESLIPGTFYAMNKHNVIEYKIDSTSEIGCYKFRKWSVSGDDMAFVPRGLDTGLALRDGSKIIHLLRNDEEQFDADDDHLTEEVFEGKMEAEFNHYLPDRNGGDISVVTVGTGLSKRTLLAVATHEETSVVDKVDFIKIYENIETGKVFHKIPSYKPSSLLSLDFNNGETLLVFLEDNRYLQVYEYKGIEGFKFKTSADMKGSKLFLMTLPMKPYLNERKVLGLIDGHRVTLIEAVMTGNQIRKDLNCGL